MELERREGKEGRKTEGNEWTTSTRKGNKGQGRVKGGSGKERGRNLGMKKGRKERGKKIKGILREERLQLDTK